PMRCSRGFCIVAGEAPAAPGRCACPQVFRDYGMRRRGTVTPWLAGFLVAATLGGGVQGADQPGDEKPLSFELDYDFRGSKPIPPGFRLAGAVRNAVVRPEPGGFRITLAGDQPNPVGRVGLEMHTTLRGDFELTAGYELLRVEEPTDGYGVGFELFAHTVHSPQQGLGVYRVARVNEGDVYQVSRNYLKADGK